MQNPNTQTSLLHLVHVLAQLLELLRRGTVTSLHLQVLSSDIKGLAPRCHRLFPGQRQGLLLVDGDSHRIARRIDLKIALLGLATAVGPNTQGDPLKTHAPIRLGSSMLCADEVQVLNCSGAHRPAGFVIFGAGFLVPVPKLLGNVVTGSTQTQIFLIAFTANHCGNAPTVESGRQVALFIKVYGHKWRQALFWLCMHEYKIDGCSNEHHPSVLSDGFRQHQLLRGLFQFNKGRAARLQPIKPPVGVMGESLDNGHPVKVPLIQPVPWPGCGLGDALLVHNHGRHIIQWGEMDTLIDAMEGGCVAPVIVTVAQPEVNRISDKVFDQHLVRITGQCQPPKRPSLAKPDHSASGQLRHPSRKEVIHSVSDEAGLRSYCFSIRKNRAT